MNIFKDSIGENSIINLHIPIIQCMPVINFAIFVSVLLSTWGGAVEYFKVMLIFISGMHFLQYNYNRIECLPLFITHEP